ncbi:MAG TPA: FliM/FliN family flagellar motor switch protein [Candidatus Hydrogenedentes bacterium]|nr:FliM/FliN family flagellar motor switch protein [Candidatus Hydrogenedentota bacterium]HPC15428.1 FliM/FliN family flagellar motor switch protein [Candidatus Hydrogenedentota bacterium]
MGIEDLKKVRLVLTIDLGQTTLAVRDVLELKQGSVVPLNKLAGEMTDIFVNGIPLAKGEIVVIADGIHVRIAEIIGATPVEEKEEGEYDA